MPLVNLRTILKGCVEKHTAVGAFDVLDHTFAEAAIEAAQETNTPIIIMVGDFEGPDYDNFYPYLTQRLKRASVPVCLHFDHGESFERCMLAIRRGCTSVMIDGSALPFEENVALTKKVVEAAHACGVDVEGELGCIGSGAGTIEGGQEGSYTDPQLALEFVRLTGVDALAVGIGTVHGVYRGEPKLDFPRLEEIRKLVDIPLVLHGGSGLSTEDFRQAIRSGINKINAFTGLSIAVADAVRRKANEAGPGINVVPLIQAATQTGIQEIKRHIKIFQTEAQES
ncbi:class II fructose-bisphosphate aldolase [Luxibacter massiliensis]|uniref:class II fructose-bisphosphate aldolase n=1 Tax=Luxibacter massiliensis TaxID=2219695 RepID=UPI000F05C15E|nr:class II fructose-bisphosphate aldolase [Luxibacter massiliensis]